MLLNSRGFCEGRKFNLATNHLPLKTLFLTHMLSKSGLPQLFGKLTTRRTFLSNLKLCSKTSKELCYQTREGFVKFFQDFKSPTLSLPISILPKLLQPSNLLSFFLPFTKDYSFSFYLRRLWKQNLSRFELKIMFGKESKMIQLHPFKEKEARSPLGG